MPCGMFGRIPCPTDLTASKHAVSKGGSCPRLWQAPCSSSWIPMRAGHPQLREMEREFWAGIDALTPGIDRGEFRRRVLGLVFLRYLDVSFADRRLWLERESRDARSVYFSLDEERHQILGRPDAYHAAGIAFVVPAARWDRLDRMAASSDPGNL